MKGSLKEVRAIMAQYGLIVKVSHVTTDPHQYMAEARYNYYGVNTVVCSSLCGTRKEARKEVVLLIARDLGL